MQDFEHLYKKSQKVKERYYRWLSTNSFIWTVEHVRRIKRLNDVIIEKENSLYELLSKAKNDIEKLIAEGCTYYEAYDIDAYLSYEADSYASPIADEKTMLDVYYCTGFNLCTCLHTSLDKPLESREVMFMRDVNWNNDLFRDFPDRNYYISRFLHVLVESETYTMEDLMYLNPEDFVECLEIRN